MYKCCRRYIVLLAVSISKARFIQLFGSAITNNNLVLDFISLLNFLNGSQKAVELSSSVMRHMR